MSISKKLSSIQSELIAPKNQTNTFGGYKYRSCEDIVEAVKPLLAKEGLVLLITDEMVECGGRIYVKATATIKDAENALFVSAYAREAEHQKGMNDSQLTGSTSSYARKYALNGLFAIDDTKDADATNTHDKGETSKTMTKDELATRFQICKHANEVKNAYKKYKPDVDALPEAQRKAMKTLVADCIKAHESGATQ